MHTAKDFTIGRQVRNLKTGETGTIVDSGGIVAGHDRVIIIYDDEDGSNGGWVTPIHKLELLPAPTYDTFPEGEG